MPGWLDSLFGGGGDPTVTQTNEVQYSPQQQQLFDMAFPRLQQFGSQDLTLPSNTVQGFNENELAAQQAALGQVGSINQLGSNAANSLNFLMNPNMLSPDSNPWLRQQGQALSDQSMDALLQRALPALRGGFSMQGGPYGGGMSKEGIATGMATGESMAGLQSALGNLYGNAYNTGLNTMLQANQLAPTIQGAQLAGSSVQGAVGQQQREMGQAQLDAQNQQDLMRQLLPLMQARELYGIGTAMPGARGVSTATGATPPGPGIAGGALGGAAAGSVFGPWGTLLGGGLGGLLGAFG